MSLNLTREQMVDPKIKKKISSKTKIGNLSDAMFGDLGAVSEQNSKDMRTTIGGISARTESLSTQKQHQALSAVDNSLNKLGVTHSVPSLSDVETFSSQALAQGDSENAAHELDKAANEFLNLGHVNKAVTDLLDESSIFQELGENAQAASAAQEAGRLLVNENQTFIAGSEYASAGGLLKAAGQSNGAAQDFAQAAVNFESAGRFEHALSALDSELSLNESSAKHDAASEKTLAHDFNVLAADSKQSGDIGVEAQARAGAGGAYVEAGQYSSAYESYAHAAAEFAQSGANNSIDQAMAYAGEGSALKHIGNETSAAANAYGQAAVLFSQLGYTQDAEKADYAEINEASVMVTNSRFSGAEQAINNATANLKSMGIDTSEIQNLSSVVSDLQSANNDTLNDKLNHALSEYRNAFNELQNIEQTDTTIQSSTMSEIASNLASSNGVAIGIGEEHLLARADSLGTAGLTVVTNLISTASAQSAIAQVSDNESRTSQALQHAANEIVSDAVKAAESQGTAGSVSALNNAINDAFTNAESYAEAGSQLSASEKIAFNSEITNEMYKADSEADASLVSYNRIKENQLDAEIGANKSELEVVKTELSQDDAELATDKDGNITLPSKEIDSIKAEIEDETNYKTTIKDEIAEEESEATSYKDAGVALPPKNAVNIKGNSAETEAIENDLEADGLALEESTEHVASKSVLNNSIETISSEVSSEASTETTAIESAGEAAAGAADAEAASTAEGVAAAITEGAEAVGSATESAAGAVSDFVTGLAEDVADIFSTPEA